MVVDAILRHGSLHAAVAHCRSIAALTKPRTKLQDKAWRETARERTAQVIMDSVDDMRTTRVRPIDIGVWQRIINYTGPELWEQRCVPAYFALTLINNGAEHSVGFLRHNGINPCLIRITTGIDNNGTHSYIKFIDVARTNESIARMLLLFYDHGLDAPTLSGVDRRDLIVNVVIGIHEPMLVFDSIREFFRRRMSHPTFSGAMHKILRDLLSKYGTGSICLDVIDRLIQRKSIYDSFLEIFEYLRDNTGIVLDPMRVGTVINMLGHTLYDNVARPFRSAIDCIVMTRPLAFCGEQCENTYIRGPFVKLSELENLKNQGMDLNRPIQADDWILVAARHLLLAGFHWTPLESNKFLCSGIASVVAGFGYLPPQKPLVVASLLDLTLRCINLNRRLWQGDLSLVMPPDLLEVAVGTLPSLSS